MLYHKMRFLYLLQIFITTILAAPQENSAVTPLSPESGTGSQNPISGNSYSYPVPSYSYSPRRIPARTYGPPRRTVSLLKII